MKTLALNFAADHPVFAGHFPGMPIVPGVMLLDAAARAIATDCGFSGGAWQINSVKFLSPLQPDETAMLKFETQANGSVRFDIAVGERSIASGSMTLSTA